MLDATLQPEGVDEVSVEIDEIETEDNLQNQEYETIASANTALESYIDILKSNDGLTRQSAAILNVGLNNCFKTLGLKQESTGLEDYVSCNSLDARTQATVSIESLLEKAKAGIKKAIEWIIERLKKLKAWYNGFGNKAKKTKEEIEDLHHLLMDKDITAGTEFKLTEKWSFQLKPSIRSNTFVNESTTEIYKRMVLLNKDYAEIVRRMALAMTDEEEEQAKTERYEAIAELMKDITLENNFTFKNARLENKKIIADFEVVEVELGEQLTIKTRNKSAIDGDLKACDVIVDQSLKLSMYLAESADKFTKIIKDINPDMDSEALSKIIAENRLAVENIVNNSTLRQVYVKYLDYILTKISAIKLEIEVGSRAVKK